MGSSSPCGGFLSFAVFCLSIIDSCTSVKRSGDTAKLTKWRHLVKTAGTKKGIDCNVLQLCGSTHESEPIFSIFLIIRISVLQNVTGNHINQIYNRAALALTQHAARPTCRLSLRMQRLSRPSSKEPVTNLATYSDHQGDAEGLYSNILHRVWFPHARCAG